MGQPRSVLSSSTYLVTRRAYQRTFRLRPHVITNQIVMYAAALAAEKTGVVLHAYVVMSNHHHLVVTDTLGLMPDFLRELHRTIAKALNAAQGQWENLWAAEQSSAVLLPEAVDVLDKVAYCAANPVAAGLVRTPQAWPGVNLWKPGTAVRVSRPKAYFDPRGALPETLELKLQPLPGVRDWLALVDEAVAKAVTRARASVAKQGLQVLGPAAIQKKSFLTKARTYEEKRKPNPLLAAKDVITRLGCIRKLRTFRAAYHQALAAWKEGRREALFPPGTWWMRVHHGAAVRAAPA